MRRVDRRVRRLEEVYLAVLKLKPRPWTVRAARSIDNREAEYVSIKRECCVGILHHERNVMKASTTWFCHERIMP
jgi:hypothetical protein